MILKIGFLNIKFLGSFVLALASIAAQAAEPSVAASNSPVPLIPISSLTATTENFNILCLETLKQLTEVSGNAAALPSIAQQKVTYCQSAQTHLKALNDATVLISAYETLTAVCVMACAASQVHVGLGAALSAACGGLAVADAVTEYGMTQDVVGTLEDSISVIALVPAVINGKKFFDSMKNKGVKSAAANVEKKKEIAEVAKETSKAQWDLLSCAGALGAIAALVLNFNNKKAASDGLLADLKNVDQLLSPIPVPSASSVLLTAVPVSNSTVNNSSSNFSTSVPAGYQAPPGGSLGVAHNCSGNLQDASSAAVIECATTLNSKLAPFQNPPTAQQAANALDNPGSLFTPTPANSQNLGQGVVSQLPSSLPAAATLPLANGINSYAASATPAYTNTKGSNVNNNEDPGANADPFSSTLNSVLAQALGKKDPKNETNNVGLDFDFKKAKVTGGIDPGNGQDRSLFDRISLKIKALQQSLLGF